MINYALKSDIGKVRKQNEDETIFYRSEKLDHLYVFGVIDGVGGHDGGEIASGIFKKSIESYSKDHLADNDVDGEQFVRHAMLFANKEVNHNRLKSEAYSRMACVSTFGLINTKTRELYIAHIGDTRAYLYSRELVKITKDHSYVGKKEDQGLLSEVDAMNHPKRNIITKYIGLTDFNAEYVETYKQTLLFGDIILFCTDGLTDLVTSEKIFTILSSDVSCKEKVDRLIDQANHYGGKDNITVGVFEFENKVTNINRKNTVVKLTDITKGSKKKITTELSQQKENTIDVNNRLENLEIKVQRIHQIVRLVAVMLFLVISLLVLQLISNIPSSNIEGYLPSIENKQIVD